MSYTSPTGTNWSRAICSAAMTASGQIDSNDYSQRSNSPILHGESWLALADYYESDVETEEFPEYVIHSEADLRSHLSSMIAGPPRIVELYSPQDEFLRIGIGGGFAGMAWIRLPVVQTLLSQRIEASSSVAFEIQGQPSTLRPEELHRPEDIVELACQFFLHSRLPEGLDWRQSKC